MGNVTNAALFYCKLKRYVALFLIGVCVLFIIGGISAMSQNPKGSEKYKRARNISGLSMVGVVVFTLSYFFLKTNFGCGFAIADNAYHLIRN